MGELFISSHYLKSGQNINVLVVSHTSRSQTLFYASLVFKADEIPSKSARVMENCEFNFKYQPAEVNRKHSK